MKLYIRKEPGSHLQLLAYDVIQEVRLADGCPRAVVAQPSVAEVHVKVIVRRLVVDEDA